MLLFLFLCNLVASNFESEMKKIQTLSLQLDTLLNITSNTYLETINTHLELLNDEYNKVEEGIKLIGKTIEGLEHTHTNFDKERAQYVREIVKKIESLVDKLDEKIHSIDTSYIKTNLPSAIVGHSTIDNQAKNSVIKIKQESEKLESVIGSNSKFIWVWGIIFIIGVISLGTYFTINKASRANI